MAPLAPPEVVRLTGACFSGVIGVSPTLFFLAPLAPRGGEGLGVRGPSERDRHFPRPVVVRWFSVQDRRVFCTLTLPPHPRPLSPAGGEGSQVCCCFASPQPPQPQQLKSCTTSDGARGAIRTKCRLIPPNRQTKSVHLTPREAALFYDAAEKRLATSSQLTTLQKAAI